MKQALILLSGTLSDKRLWQHQLEHLSDLATLSVPDLTGHSEIREAARAVLEHAPAQFSLAGFSMGGIIAQEILRQAPERVLKLALLGTSTGKPGPDKLERFKTWCNATQSEFERMLETLPTWVHPENKYIAPVIKGMAKDLGLEVFRRQGGILLTQQNDDPKVLQGYSRPTLICHGANDPVSSLQGNSDMAKLFPKARRVQLPRCGHYAPLEKPEAVSAVLAYWLQEDVE